MIEEFGSYLFHPNNNAIGASYGKGDGKISKFALKLQVFLNISENLRLQ
jgi:hypothetical protein